MTTRLQIIIQGSVERENDGDVQSQQVQIPAIVAYSRGRFQAAWAELGDQIATLWDAEVDTDDERNPGT